MMGFALASCGPEAVPEVRSPSLDVSDSAGIALHVNHTPVWQGGGAWTIAADPTLQIGEFSGAEPYLFTSISAAARFDDGRIVVAEALTREIRVFDANGSHIHTFGGGGEGPGQFGTGMLELALGEPKTVVVWDSSLRRFSWFDAGGELQRVESLGPVLPAEALSIGRAPWQIRPDGGLLVGAAGEMDEGTGDRVWTRSAQPTVISPGDRRVRVFGPFPISERTRVVGADGSGRTFGNPLGPIGVFALAADPYPLVVAGTGAWELREFAWDGSLSRVIRAAVPRMPISDRALSDLHDSIPVLARRLSASESRVEAAFERLMTPDSLPAIGYIVIDTEGNRWVGRRDGSSDDVSSVFDVIDPAGRWLGPVEMVPLSDHFVAYDEVLSIDDEFVLVRWKDELDVVYLRLHAISKPG